MVLKIGEQDFEKNRVSMLEVNAAVQRSRSDRQ